MGRYSIKEIEKLSGIKAHTIRIWEKRHNIVSPKRTDTNIRYYDDDDLKKVLNISILQNNGLKISKIALLNHQELTDMVMEISEIKSETDIHIDQLIISMIELDELMFENLLSQLALKYGFEKTALEIIYPFLEKIGILWLSGNISPAQEHFISNLIRQKIIVAIDGIHINFRSTTKDFVLFLPENELHELGLLFFNYLIRKAGFSTVYLGQNVPWDDLVQVADAHHPKYILGIITASVTKKKLQTMVKLYSEQFSEQKVFLTGLQISQHKIEYPENVFPFKDTQALKEVLSRLQVEE